MFEWFDERLVVRLHQGEAPAYGYEMTKRLRSRGLSIVGEGSIYPLLGRLERDRLVETYRAASDGGPPRKY